MTDSEDKITSKFERALKMATMSPDFPIIDKSTDKKLGKDAPNGAVVVHQQKSSNTQPIDRTMNDSLLKACYEELGVYERKLRKDPENESLRQEYNDWLALCQE